MSRIIDRSQKEQPAVSLSGTSLIPVAKPILFSEPMVRAILEGRKTQTRRVIRSQPFKFRYANQVPIDTQTWCLTTGLGDGVQHFVCCPYGKSGDHLWVRENMFMPRWASRLTLEIESVRVQRLQQISDTDARAEGVTADCREDHLTHELACHIEAFTRLWDSINAKRGYGWDVNPWVWAISFRTLQPKEEGVSKRKEPSVPSSCAAQLTNPRIRVIP